MNYANENYFSIVKNDSLILKPLEIDCIILKHSHEKTDNYILIVKMTLLS